MHAAAFGPQLWWVVDGCVHQAERNGDMEQWTM
jgi:hypothetical protein